MHRRGGHARIYRAGSSAFLYVGSGAATIAVLLYAAAEVATRASIDSATSIAIVSIMVLLAALYAVAWWRSYRSCVEAGASGVAVRNVVRTYRIDWNEILEFTWEPHPYYHRTGVVNLRDGRRIRAFGIRSVKSMISSEGPGESEIHMLNAELHRARARAKFERRAEGRSASAIGNVRST